MQPGKKAIFLDIDGTLLHDIHQPPCRADLDALYAARRAGHAVLINTGRSPGALPDILRQADYLDGLVMGCGTVLRLGNETVFSHCLAEDCLRQVLRYLAAHPEMQGVLEGENGVYCVGSREGGWQYHVLNEAEFFDRFPEERVSKVTVCTPPAPAHRAFFSQWFTLIEQPTWYECVLPGCDKGAGLLKACEILGVIPENSLAVGDSCNDLDMFRAAGVAVAMENALDELKQAADDVTLPCGQGGVGAAVRKWILEE